MTWVCMASGPSLTEDDIEVVRRSGLPVVAVNSTWEKVRFCQAIYAGDMSWWRNNLPKIDIPAERWTCSPEVAREFGIRHHKTGGPYNSGLRAIQWAGLRTDRIILLGYDCKLGPSGESHHHEDHPTRNPTSRNCGVWLRQFRVWALIAQKRGINIVNCTRETALDCWPRLALEDAIAHFDS